VRAVPPRTRRPALPICLLAALAPACAIEDAPATAERERAIIGGAPTASGDHPAVGALWEDEVTCTGTLIRADVVLTAAHCLEVASDALGFTLELEPGEAAPPAVHPVCRAIMHPRFATSDAELNDVGLVFLDEPIAGAAVLPLATAADTAALAVGDDVELVGYGWTALAPGARKVQNAAPSTVTAVAATELEVGDAAQPTFCFGDGGGPVLATIDGAPRVVAVASRGASGSAPCEGATIVTRVDAHRAWILDELAAHDTAGGCAPPPDAGVEPPDAAAEPDAGVPTDDDDDGDDDGGAGGCAATGGHGEGAAALVVVGIVVGVGRRRSRRPR
jgi:secreted trypsin-like serine protease